MTILNVRGTSGSGKTTLVRRLLETEENYPVVDFSGLWAKHPPKHTRERIVAYKLPERHIVVLGSYVNTCGGCDSISSMDYVEWLLRDAHRAGWHVVFEGLIVTSVSGRFKRFSAEVPGEYVWCFLDTPLETCIQNVYKRNGGKEFKHSNLESKWNLCQKSIRQLRDEGERVVILDHAKAWEQFEALLPEAGTS